MAMGLTRIRIATRQSKLALWQANHISQQLQTLYPQLQVELAPMLTAGDQRPAPLTSDGGKALFVKELQAALLTDKADIAVHCIKDMSVHDTPGLCLAAICEREDPRDVLISPHSYTSLLQLPAATKIGTGSPRRQCQLLALRPDFNVLPLRGNIDTRLRRAWEGDLHAILLAAAGLHRLQCREYIRCYLDPGSFIPAIGQGALGIECREDDMMTRELLAPLDDQPTRVCITAERAVNRYLKGDCLTPIGVHAWIKDEQIHINAMLGGIDGRKILRASQSGTISHAESLGYQIGAALMAQGAAELL